MNFIIYSSIVCLFTCVQEQTVEENSIDYAIEFNDNPRNEKSTNEVERNSDTPEEQPQYEMYELKTSNHNRNENQKSDLSTEDKCSVLIEEKKINIQAKNKRSNCILNPREIYVTFYCYFCFGSLILSFLTVKNIVS